MNKNWLVFWVIFFWLGIAVLFLIPEDSLATPIKFVCIGVWGSIVTWLSFRGIRAAEEREREMREFEEQVAEAKAEEEKQAKEEEEEEAREQKPVKVVEVPRARELAIKEWEALLKIVLRNRPFSEAVNSFKELLQKIFPGSSGILYMYNGRESEMSKIFKYGEVLLGEDVISPMECASFNKGDVVHTDFEHEDLSDGCPHLKKQKTGFAFCVPVEALEEHYGILSVYSKELSEGARAEWQLHLRIVAAIFGLFVADKNLNVRFEEHNIRDMLTGLFNRRYMEESLRREFAAAARHKTPIGMLTLFPDSIYSIRSKYGAKVADQFLWELGQRLPKYIRFEDIPCRYENETFCIIMPGAEFNVMTARAEKIRQDISALEISYSNLALKTTLSLGVSAYPQFARTPEDLIRASLSALQVAVKTGPNKVVTSLDLHN